MSWLMNRHSKVAWQCTTLAAVVIVFLCCFVTLADMLFVNDADDSIFVLLPATAIVLLCSALVTAAVLFSWSPRRLWFPALVLPTLCVGLFINDSTSVRLIDGIDRVQGAAWSLLLLSWLVWLLPRVGKPLMLLLNLVLFLCSLWLVLVGGAVTNSLLSSSPLTTLNSAILFSLNALANIALNLSYPKKLHIELRSLGFALSVFIACAVTLIWFNNTHRMQQQVQNSAETLSGKLQQSVSDLVQTQQGLLTRMVKRASVLDSSLTDTYFAQDGQGYLADFPYIEYIALTKAQNAGLWSAALRNDVQRWFDHYLAQRLPALLQQHPVPTSEAMFFADYDAKIDHSLLYVFYQRDNNSPVQIVAASVNYALALEKMVAGILTNGYQLKIYQPQNQVLLYQSAQYPEHCIKSHQFTIRLHDTVNWQATGCDSLKTIPTGLLISSEIALYAGFIAIFLALLSQQLQQKSQKHQTRLLSANLRLRQSITEQQRLRLNQQQIMNNSADAICIIDATGCFVELSSSAETIFGYPLTELIGKPFIDFVHPADREVTVLEAEHLKEGNATLNFRNRYIRKDGSVVHLLWSARYVTDIDVLYAIAHDISELERQERFQIAQQKILKLISLEDELAGIFNHICDMAQQYLPGVKAVLTRVSGKNLKLVAAPAFSAELSRFLAAVNISLTSLPCGIAAYKGRFEICENLLQSAAWQLLPAQIKDEAGQACWSMPILTSSGSVQGTFALYIKENRIPKNEEHELMVLCCRLAGIAIEKMQQRQALQESEQRYRSLYEFNPDPVFSLDLAGNFLNINSAGVALLGRNEEQIIGQHYARLIQPEMLAQVEQHFAIVVQGTAQRYETVVQVPGRTAVDFMISNLPIIVDGKVVGVFGIAKDVTERNQTSRALQHSLTRLSLQTSALQGLNECATGIRSYWDNPQTLRYVIGELSRIMHCCQASILLTDASYEAAPIWFTQAHDGHQELTEAQARFLLDILAYHRFDGFVFDSENIQNFQGAALQPDLCQFLLDNRIVASPVCDREGAIIGCLLVTDCECRSFDQDEQLLTAQFAKLIFSALEYRQLLQSMIAAERDLQQQLQFNTAVTDSMSDVLLVTDMTGNVSVVNPSAERLLAQCGISVAHQLISEILPLQPQNWQPDCFYESELELRILDQRLNYTCKVTPLKTNDNQVGWLVTLHDISAERRAAAVSHERDQFFTLSLELFCLVDLAGCFVQVNPAFSRVLEYLPADLIGQPYMSVIDSKDHQLIYDAVMKLRQGHDIHDLEFRVISRTGRLCWLQLSAALSGDIIFCAARDISARKTAQKQLEQTLQELKRSNEELNEFAYVASHDLQEPLRKIRTFGDRLLQKVSQEDTAIQDYVARMCNAAERMQNLISDLLTYSRLNAGQLSCTVVDMPAITQDILALMDDVISQTAAQITIDIQANPVADERQLKQLLQNLLSNALKFHKPQQAPQIILQTLQLQDGVMLTVSDNGIGFEPQYAEKVFNPFQRLHSRTEFAGTGIGLSIVKKIAERHGATIHVNAQPGVGACFEVTFPNIQSDDVKAPVAVKGEDYVQNSVG